MQRNNPIYCDYWDKLSSAEAEYLRAFNREFEQGSRIDAMTKLTPLKPGQEKAVTEWRYLWVELKDYLEKSSNVTFLKVS